MTFHLAVGTPMFGGQCHGEFASSVQTLIRAFSKGAHKVTTLYIGNESLIQRARNAIVWQFLNATEATHLLFADADQRFRWEDVVRMIEADKPIICGPVPMKRINWEAVAAAVKRGVPPAQLERYSGIFNIVRVKEKRRVQSVYEPFPILRGGSGFMMIQREVFQQLAPLTPDYVTDTPGTAVPPGSRVHNFFPVEIHDDHLMSEDFGLCVEWRRAGGQVWCAPWCEIVHHGTYGFSGTYKDSFNAEHADSGRRPVPDYS